MFVAVVFFSLHLGSMKRRASLGSTEEEGAAFAVGEGKFEVGVAEHVRAGGLPRKTFRFTRQGTLFEYSLACK
jgi:hypothetical protein